MTIAVLIPGLLSGCSLSTHLLATHNTGTIVVEVMRMELATTSTASGGAKRGTAQTTTTRLITEGQTSFTQESFTRPGYQQAQTGNSLELYDPSDNTIFETTEQGWQAAVNRKFDQSLPEGTKSSSNTGEMFAYGPSYTAGRMSVYEQQLRAHIYKQAGHTTIDGRAAIKLVPTRRAVPRSARSGAHEVLGTVYVEPGTYDPIKEVTHTAFGPGLGTTTLVENWLVYKVLPATTANRKLLSLTARHPSARVVHSATGYLEASGSESKPVKLRRSDM